MTVHKNDDGKYVLWVDSLNKSRMISYIVSYVLAIIMGTDELGFYLCVPYKKANSNEICFETWTVSIDITIYYI